MKAILVIEMPTNCAKCKLIHLQGIGEAICNAVDWEERPSWCPLKPMPEKKVVTVKSIDDIQSYSITEVADMISAKIILKTNEVFALGWNACLDEICNEQKERKTLLKTEKESVSNRGDI